MILVAVLGYGNALDQFHYKVRPARLRSTAVMNLGNIGMVHDRQRLSFSFEASDNLSRIHARLENLQRDFAPHRLSLVGQVNHAKSTFANLFQKLVWSDDGAWDLASQLIDRRHDLGSGSR